MRSILVALPVILSAVVTAQQPSLTCHTDVGVYIDNKWTGSQVVKFLPKATAITKQTTITATGSKFGLFATTTVTPVISGRTATFLFRERAAADPSYSTKEFAGTATKTVNQGHSWLLKVPANTAGNVLVVEVKFRSQYGIGVAQLDIGNNGSLEINHDLWFGGQRTLHKTFNLGTKAVDVRIVTKANLPYRGVKDYDYEVGLTLNPDSPIKISSYGALCGLKMDTTSVVTGSGHTVTCLVRGGFVSRGAILMIGAQPASIPFPGTPCTVLVNPLLTLFETDYIGTTSFIFEVPGRIDAVAYLQAVSAHSAYGYTSLRMSNGIKVDGR